MKGLIKDPSAFLRGKQYAKHLYEFVFNFYLGEKNEYLAYTNIYAILMPKCFFEFEPKIFYIPFIEKNKSFKWNAAARDDLKDYNLDDLSI